MYISIDLINTVHFDTVLMTKLNFNLETRLIFSQALQLRCLWSVECEILQPESFMTPVSPLQICFGQIHRPWDSAGRSAN